MVGKYCEAIIFEYCVPFLNCGFLPLFSGGAIHGFFVGHGVRDKGCFEVNLQEISTIDVGN
jgi:hypothetical protein